MTIKLIFENTPLAYKRLSMSNPDSWRRESTNGKEVDEAIIGSSQEL